MNIRHARNASLVSFLVFVSGAATDGWRTFPDPVPLWGRILLVLIFITDMICLPIGVLAVHKEQRFGKRVIALSIIPLLAITFIYWVGIA